MRPENWRIVGEGEGIPVKVTVVEELGADGFVYGTSGAEGTPDNVIIRIDARRNHQQGRDALRHDRPRATCTCSTPTSGERLSTE